MVYSGLFLLILPATCLAAVKAPIYAPPRIEGNYKISKGTIRDVIARKSTKTPEGIRLSAEDLSSWYRSRGFADARVETATDRTNDRLRVTYRIYEGAKYEVSSFSAEGTDIKKSRLRKILFVNEPAKAYSPDRWNEGIRNILKTHKDKGRFETRIDSVTFRTTESRPGLRELDIALIVHTGPIYEFLGYSFTDPDAGLKDRFFKRRTLRSGKPFNHSLFTNDVSALGALLDREGYPFAKIGLSTNIATHTIGIEVSITRGSIPRYEGFTISGNTKTRDSFITILIPFNYGEPYDSRKRNHFRQSLMSSALFSQADIQPLPATNSDGFILGIRVTETSTAMITMGAMVSGNGKSFTVGGYEEVSEWNFLGRGIRISERVELHTRSQFINGLVGFPRFKAFPFSPYILPYYRYGIYGDPDDINSVYRRRDGGVFFGGSWHSLADYFAAAHIRINGYKYSELQGIPGIRSGRTYAQNTLFLQAGRSILDNPLFPSDGFAVQGTMVMAGLLAHEPIVYRKLILSASCYKPVIPLLVVCGRASFGCTSPDIFSGRGLILSEDYFYINDPSMGFTGGAALSGIIFNQWDSNIRSITPPEKGGLGKAIGSVELRCPVLKDLLTLVGFCDVGNIWNGWGRIEPDPKGWCLLTGAGIRLNIPMMPLQFYLGRRFGISKTSDLSNKLVLDFGLGGVAY
jgi:outer membrane protein assembly factor BamA